MGNREDLLAGARKAIVERGVAKTTARDIAAAAGVSLAAIGYHFGSKEQLITEALADALGTAIGDNMESMIREASGVPLLAGFAQLWNGMPEVFAQNRDSMVASMENIVRVARSSEAKDFYAESLPTIYREMGAALRTAHPNLTEEQAESIAQLYFVLAQGLGVLWVIAPNGALPDGNRLAEALTAIAGDRAGGE
ncbi:putative TetR family transcriptional regulator [Nocardia brasiliensis NBRC 14402]|uniref:TetR/AcrR family transcriptional regulator n=1 Tax=Nocardia brasiliensis TaxID=37326 RepID=UPI0002FBBE7E|nr:TetR/AcrR family transcriptional regulator [Nocardia brasiliensis]ASF07670.1 TetR family transcriptional regulator [Nocardia brasiliensis]GAJ81006.1 putative TetR family transcriptional regulator [Nocardia brasiliensis NBRC 14402]SUB54780.1 HTH-type transcriptional repressor KstR2 [Nocardia brasiliensis]